MEMQQKIQNIGEDISDNLIPKDSQSQSPMTEVTGLLR